MTQPSATIVVNKQDMEALMQIEAKNFVWDALNNHSDYKTMASYIKGQMDFKYRPNWHVVVGRSFSSYVTYENRHFIYITALGTHFLIYKS
ncbi:unnamed protein product [Lymnaea stagnalis]|uniref:Dynein light chain n=1 Tax=Lymnaea stagnalis TaxID=6523 RepID=A0AAV2HKQ1_LYMST